MSSRSSLGLASFVLVLSACGGASSAGEAPADAGSPTDASDAAADVSSATYTLATCTTDIAADAPSFYKTYFRCVTVANAADGVTITWNGLPPHPSYYWGAGSPNYAPFDTSRGAQYHPNPNTLSSRTRTMTVPSAPASRNLTITSAMVDRTMNTNPAEYRGGPVGVAIDSVPLFNDQAAPGDDIDDERFTFDAYEAHPAPGGEYHYHTASPGPLEVLVSLGLGSSRTPGASSLEVYGIMCDGTVVLGCTELDGSAPDATSLDAQNGHVGDVKDKAGTTHFAARYHTHLCPTRLPAHPYTPEIQYYQSCTVR